MMMFHCRRGVELGQRTLYSEFKQGWKIVRRKKNFFFIKNLLYLKIIGGASMVQVVAYASNKQGEYFQVCERLVVMGHLYYRSSVGLY